MSPRKLERSFALSQALVRGMPVGVAYGTWAALGATRVAVINVTCLGESLMAELELWTLAARDDQFRAELDRYNNRLQVTAARFSDDPTVVAALTATVTGSYWQVATSDRLDADQLDAILRHIAR